MFNFSVMNVFVDIQKINFNIQEKKELEANKKQIEHNIEICTVKAPVDGKLNININLEQEDILQHSEIIGSITPNSNTYKVDYTNKRYR
ncbi:hypothetical protein ACSXEJ_17055 (plasmid) [Clostridium perfringens]